MPPTPMIERLNEVVAEKCRGTGLLFLGNLPLGVEPDYKRFETWLADGKHADMGYLDRNREFRREPARLLEGRSTGEVGALPLVSVLAWNYRHQDSGQNPRIAQYAVLKDYHKLLWRKCDAIAKAVLEELDLPTSAYRALTDSAPILERALAARTGSGFIGKNTCFISHRQGSFILLCEILWDLDSGFELSSELSSEHQQGPKSDGAVNPCGTCKRCQTHCPTGALNTDYQLDANRCLAYHSIENRGTVPKEFWPAFKKFWFGCDICQRVCPHNRGKDSGIGLPRKVDPDSLDLVMVATMDQAIYERLFGGTPMTRAKIDGLRRNAIIALAVLKDPRLQEVLDFWQKNSPTPLIEATLRQAGLGPKA